MEDTEKAQGHNKMGKEQDFEKDKGGAKQR
jgi:hypothetical protein